jgi:hypothetical protein
MSDETTSSWRSKLGRANEHPLASARAKLGWANLKLQELQGQWQAFVDGDPPPISFLSELDDQKGYWRLMFGEIREPPVELGLLIGDVAHLLRTVLDQLMWELCWVDTNCRGRGRNDTRFPVYGDGDDYARHASAILDGVLKPHRTIIEMAQPYRPWYGVDPHPLALVAALDNDDKHKTVQPAAVYGGTFDLGNIMLRDCDFREGQITGWAPGGRRLKSGTELIKIPIVVTGPNPDVDVNPTLDVYLVLRNGTVIIPGLLTAAVYVEGIVEFLAPAFDTPVVRKKWRLREGRFPFKAPTHLTAVEVTIADPRWRAGSAEP